MKIVDCKKSGCKYLGQESGAWKCTLGNEAGTRPAPAWFDIEMQCQDKKIPVLQRIFK